MEINSEYWYIVDTQDPSNPCLINKEFPKKSMANGWIERRLNNDTDRFEVVLGAQAGEDKLEFIIGKFKEKVEKRDKKKDEFKKREVRLKYDYPPEYVTKADRKKYRIRIKKQNGLNQKNKE